MAALPPRGNLDGSAINQTGVFQAAIGSVYDFLSGLLGTTGTKASAQKTLGVAMVDRAYFEFAGYNLLSPNIPIDNSQPQSTEGTLLGTLTLTPKSVTNRLRVRVQIPFSSSYNVGQDFGIAAIFINGATLADLAVTQAMTVDGAMASLNMEFEWISGALTTQSVALRVGCANGVFILGANRFGQLLGGVMRATFILEELTA